MPVHKANKAKKVPTGIAAEDLAPSTKKFNTKKMPKIVPEKPKAVYSLKIPLARDIAIKGNRALTAKVFFFQF